MMANYLQNYSWTSLCPHGELFAFNFGISYKTNGLKLHKERVNTNVGLDSFANRPINDWNSMPSHT